MFLFNSVLMNNNPKNPIKSKNIIVHIPTEM